MERVYAFTDEYGSFGWKLDNVDVSSCFIISAIIVKESDLEKYAIGAEAIRKKFFQNGEMKSSSVGNNHKRRKQILEELNNLPFKIFSICVNKQKCLDNMNMVGLKYKKTFYKFMNNIVHNELRSAFENITVVADEIGNKEYMKSFCKYVINKQDMPNLFGDMKFTFEESKKDARLQIADFISGSLARGYDEHKKVPEFNDFIKIIGNKIIRTEFYPKTYDTYIIENSVIAENYDIDIAKICFAQAAKFIERNKDIEDDEIKQQVIVLKYLLFRFMNNNERKYVCTEELKGQLKLAGYGTIQDQAFRKNIIGNLRDEGVIIASSSKGYKIPATKAELYDFVNRDAGIVLPMFSRLRKCRDLIKLGTFGEVDLLAEPEYKQLRKCIEALENE